MSCISFACTIKSKEDSKIIDEIPYITLPFEKECDAGLEPFVDMTILKPKESFRLIGKFPSTNHNIYLLFSEIEGDMPIPTICVYDSCGNLLQSLPLIINGCVSDEDGSIVNKYVVNPDLSIVSTEVRSYGHWDDSFIVDSVYTTTRIARLNTYGVFEVVNNNHK